MHESDGASLGDLAIWDAPDHGKFYLFVKLNLSHLNPTGSDPPSPSLDDAYIPSNPPYSYPDHPVADSDVELEPDVDTEFESGSGWNSDLDSDSDTPRPVPVVQLITTQRGRLSYQNRRIHWSPSVLGGYIKFRVYYRHWGKGYTYLVPERLLQPQSPVSRRFTP